MLAVAGCSQPEPYAPELEVCVQDPAGLEAFKGLLKGYADAEGMTFADSSRETAPSGPSRPVVQIAVEKDGAGLAAGNTGLAFYQLAIGFSGAKAEREKLSADVVRLLERRWTVEPVGEGGLVIDPECGRYANWKG
ncbi:hypothetical protein [Caulobacter sp. NIBR2454]|uniref:hypothetical protein n=1 Tax=Caulobacter sp. NIBR2454 TaxID=3015996 RepID=UPI0022B6B811|nr:hypothetical protein [Caulobacter sp. NIBR2454]